MANHGRIKTNQRLSEKEIDEVVEKTISKYNLGSLKLEKGPCYGDVDWWLSIDNYNAVHFWIADNKLSGEEVAGEWVEYIPPKIISEKSAIEFRHGHSIDIMWYLESLFMYEFQQAFGGVYEDDGGETDPIIKYESLDEYVKYFDGTARGAWWNDSLKAMEHSEIGRQLIKDWNLHPVAEKSTTK